jgi:putative sterol carrier protein
MTFVSNPGISVTSVRANASYFMGGTTMVDATAQFFEELGQRGHEPLLQKTRGTLQVDLVNGKTTEHWLVAVEKGDIEVSHRDGKADCTLRARREVFDGLARGEINAFAAMLRGTLGVEGNFELLVLFQRLFPGPQDTTSGRKT